MKKYAHLLLLFVGISVSLLAAIRLLDHNSADAFRQLKSFFGIRILAFMFAPFIVMTGLGLMGVAWRWSRIAQQAWLVTNCLVTLAAVALYVPMIWEGKAGCMDFLALSFVPFFAWPTMVGVWLLTWIVLQMKYDHSAAA